MKNEYNNARPLVMHIDLNSCFATIEQQARPTLRGRPVAVLNRRTEYTAIVTASYEAKREGVTVGMKFREAKKLVPGLVGLESDPPKYRYVYHKLLDIMNRYSAHVTMKSIDEGVIDFSKATEYITRRDLMDIGCEIKQALLTEVGCAMLCNVGIATNRFLAKTAAGLDKPNGLTAITAHTIRNVYARLGLTDLTGIARHNQDRLNKVGIYTPLQFLDADAVTLQKVVFKSINGVYWHQRLRGWEVDDVSHDMKSVGRQYVLESFSLTRLQILQRLHHLCESVGHRLRLKGRVARGVYVYVRTRERQYWHRRQTCQLPFFSNDAIYNVASQLFMAAPGDIKEIGVTCYNLQDKFDDQLSLFGDDLVKTQRVTSAIDEVNRRFGDRTIHTANTLGTGMYIKQRVPFGSTRYM